MKNESWRLALYAEAPVVGAVRRGEADTEPLIASKIPRLLNQVQECAPDSAPLEVVVVYPPWLEPQEVDAWVAELVHSGVDPHVVRCASATEVLGSALYGEDQSRSFALIDAATSRCAHRMGATVDVHSGIETSDTLGIPVVILGDHATSAMVRRELGERGVAAEQYTYTDLVALALHPQKLKKTQVFSGFSERFRRTAFVVAALLALLLFLGQGCMAGQGYGILPCS